MDFQLIKELALAFWDELKSHRRAVAISFIAILFTLLGVAKFWPDTYTAQALIQADRKNITADLLRNQAAFHEAPPARLAQQLIRTRLILSEAAKALGIISATSKPEDINLVLSDFSDNLTSQTVSSGSNNLLMLKFSSNDPQQAYASLSTLLEVFIENSSKEKQLDSLETFQFIDSKVQEYRTKLEIAERKLSEFQSRNTDGSEAEVVARINTLRNQLKTLAIDIDEANTKIRSIKRRLNAEQDYQKTKVELASHTEQRRGLQTQLDELRLTFKDAYPEIVSLKSQISDLDQKIDQLQSVVPGSYNSDNAREEVALFDELRKQLSDAEVSLEGMQQRKRSTKELLNSEEARARRIALNEAELTELTRDYNTINNIYQDFLKQRESADLSASIDREGQGMVYQIREHPVVPTTPSGLRSLHFLIAGPILGLLIPIALLIAYVYLDPRIRNASNLKAQLPEGLELLGSIPAYSSKEVSGSYSKTDILFLSLTLIALLTYSYMAFI